MLDALVTIVGVGIVGLCVAAFLFAGTALMAFVLQIAWDHFPVMWFAHHHLGFWEAFVLILVAGLPFTSLSVAGNAAKK